jgi:hypothetical protein
MVMDTSPPSTFPSVQSAAARMRQHRLLRKKGIRCVRLRVNEAEIERLSRAGYLPLERKIDLASIETALKPFISDGLLRYT